MERGVLETHAARNGGKRVEQVRLDGRVEDGEGREIRRTETGEERGRKMGKRTRMDGRMDGWMEKKGWDGGSFAILSSLVAGIDRRIKPRQTYFPWLVSVCWLPTQCFVTRILASGQAHFKWTYYIMSLANQCFVGT